MFVRNQPNSVDLNQAFALRLLRSCPKATNQLDISDEDKRALCAFRQLLARNTRRPLKISISNTPRMTCDEQCILNTLAAIQQGNEEQVDKKIEWLVPKWGAQEMRKLFSQLAVFFQQQDIHLPLSHAPQPVKRAEASLYVAIG